MGTSNFWSTSGPVCWGSSVGPVWAKCRRLAGFTVKMAQVCVLQPYHNKGRGLSLVGAATSIIFAVTKKLSQQTWQTHVCHNKTCLSQLNTSFVTTKVCLLQQNFCCDKFMFVATKVLLRQAYFCRDKRRALLWQTRVCMVVMTKVLSQQKWYLWQLPPMTWVRSDNSPTTCSAAVP